MTEPSFHPLVLDAVTRWPMELDAARGSDSVPYGRYRRCIDCRGRGLLRDLTCRRCDGIPYVDSSDPRHWCPRCLGARKFTVPNHTAFSTVQCPGMWGWETTNAVILEAALTARDELTTLCDDIEGDHYDTEHMADLADLLPILAAQLQNRLITDSRAIDILTRTPQ